MNTKDIAAHIRAHRIDLTHRAPAERAVHAAIATAARSTPAEHDAALAVRDRLDELELATKRAMAALCDLHCVQGSAQ